ncbi:MAG TPA: ATP-dependent DNA helicase RecG [Candidatus Paceibacterota bacterium]|nr:ATP-dependent DNA helicase RecG [Candidatus Paceibacterota bacterium]
MAPADPLEKLFPKLKPEQRRALKRLKIATLHDLLYHFPSRYEAAGPSATIAGVAPGASATLYGVIRKPEARKSWKSRRPLAEAWLEDASGRIKLMWFSQPYIAKSLREGMAVKVSGRVAGSGSGAYLANPEVDRAPIDPEEAHASLFSPAPGPAPAPAVFPVYPESEGISSLWFFHAIGKTLKALAGALADPLPPELLRRYRLPAFENALIYIHRPRRAGDAAAARKRFAFEQILALTLALEERRRTVRATRALELAPGAGLLEAFVASFPFPPTRAQRRAIAAIARDLARPVPMLRLLEGDVGSGKTAVAAAAAYLAAAAGAQVAYLCPTEVLAKQHFSTFVSYFRAHPIPIGLITGSETRVFPSRVSYEESAALSRATFRKRVADGLIPIVIGTHALIQETLSFKRLALAVIEEQHRFGTAHRQKLVTKQGSTLKQGRTLLTPHLLSMTATPIPRTLALTLYGDLDLSVLDELPAGRRPVITEVVAPAARAAAYERMRAELAAGRQAYVICPRIDPAEAGGAGEPQKREMRSVKAEAARLAQEVFPEFDIGILHSKMTPAEKEESMRMFAAGEVQILVATSVVEVGVNVPNATVILIEGAERFGLAQLHQLRGRVIRSDRQAYCFLLAESKAASVRARLTALITAKNGFELAKRDLALRGAGELMGGNQWGVSDIAMESLGNLRLVEAARSEAKRLLAKDPELASYPLLARLARGAAATIHLE